MRALKKVWEFNRLHPHHVGYSVRIRDNYAKKKPIPPSWTPEQILKKEILEKREFDEFWHLQEKYYKQPQFCDPYLPCTFRGKLSVGKALANDFFESDFKDGRNVHLQVAGNEFTKST